MVEPGGPKPPGFDLSTGPGLGSRGMEQLRESAEAAEKQAAEQRERLASPAAREEREKSLTDFVGISGVAARELADEEFGKQLAGIQEGLGFEAIAGGREVQRFADDHTVVLAGNGKRPPVLVESPLPLRAVDDDGRKRTVDLSLERRGDVFEPVNAAADVVLPGSLEEGVQVGEIGVDLTESATGGVSSAGGERVFYPDAQTDTDVVVTPLVRGAEVFWQLRSPRAPQDLVMDLDLPDGALAQAQDSGAVAITRDGKPLASVSPPLAVDAQGRDVPVKVSVQAGRVVVSLAHRDADLAYPILVDPAIEDYGAMNGDYSWLAQDPDALAGLWRWFNNHSGVPANTYSPRYNCYVPVSCDPVIYNPIYDSAKNDGLHLYVHAGVSYPAGSFGQWLYTPPGTSTKIESANLLSFYHRRGGSQSPIMYTGLWNATGFMDYDSYTMDHAGVLSHSGDVSKASPHYLVFGFQALTTVTNGSWRDGYIGAAQIALTDPESPTISAPGLHRYDVPEVEGAAQWNARSTASWFKPGDKLALRPTITDPGLGIKKIQVDGPVGIHDEFDRGCVGGWQVQCPATWPSTEGDQLSFKVPSSTPEGSNSFTIHAWDAIARQATPHGFSLKVDNQAPVIDDGPQSTFVASTLWIGKELDNLEPEQQAVLTPGSHAIEVSASDVVPSGQVRSGVEKLEIKVDGQQEAVSELACPAGNCTKTVNWSYDTAQFSGRHKIQVVATDGAGNTASKTWFVNAPGSGKLLSPADDEVTSSKVALQAKDDDDDFTGVKFQYRKRGPLNAWTTISSNLTTDAGVPVAQEVEPIGGTDRKTDKLIWDVRTALNSLTAPKPTKIQVRALFVGGSADYGSQVANVDLDEKGLSADNADAPIGPGTVDLLTGNFSYTVTDATLPNFGAPISITRTFNSLAGTAQPWGPVGQGWTLSAPVDGISEYNSLTVASDGGVDIFDAAAQRMRFDKTGETSFLSPAGYESLTLVRVPVSGQLDRYELTDLDGVVTTFSKQGDTGRWVPTKVLQPGATSAASFYYDEWEDEPRLRRIVAPAHPTAVCNLTTLDRGCGALILNYGAFGDSGTRLSSISHTAYDPAVGSMQSETVAEYQFAASQLLYARDPRLAGWLSTLYQYDGYGRLIGITPPSEAKWSMAYNDISGSLDFNKLTSVSRTTPSGLEAYETAWRVPLSGSGAPYSMAASNLDDLGQTDFPTDATAVIPSSQLGTAQLSKGTVFYLNQDARTVNVAAPGGAIKTSEYDAKGNVTRELSGANRAKVIQEGGDAATHAGLLSTHRTYSSNGLRLVEELGPEHEVKLDSGQVVRARAHTVTSYDEGLGANEKRRHLPTTVTTGAQVDPSDPDEDVRITKTEYDWTLRLPTKTIVDPGSGKLNITRQTDYNSYGLETSSRQPKSSGSDAGTTKTFYYGDSSESGCTGNFEWFNLPCKTKPAAQPGTSGLPDLPVTTYTYNRRLQVATATEQVGSSSRTTTITYDAAGRKLTEAVGTAGADLPSGLVAAYGFEEGSGSSVADGSGLNNTGTISGASWTTSGKYGKALDFDGTNDKVSVPDSSSLDLTTGMTVSAWVKPDATSGWRTALMKESSSHMAYGMYARTSSAGKPSIELNGAGGELLGSSALTTGAWSYLTATYDGSTVRFYVNGIQVSSKSASGSLPNTSSPLSIGGNGVWSNEFFDGLIDEVRIYNRALSAQEVQEDRDISVAAQTQNTLGEPVPTVTYGYSSTTGRPTTVSSSAGTLTTGYDNAGRVTSYTDADGTTSTTNYDTLGRVAATNDGKGTQSLSYDSTTGQLTTLTDSHAGTFTASYDANGRMTSKTYPNGMKADTTYDEAGSPVSLKYTKTSNCSSNCVWIDEQVAESIHGQWRTHSWEFSNQEYTYDKAGRLTNVQDDIDAPSGIAGCTIRSYAFDENSNRTSMTKKAPGAGGACNPGATGTQTSYSYDSADRLTGAGIVYDKFGRTKKLPAQYSGGGALTYSYYTNDQVRAIAQDGVSKTYSLDPTGRQRQNVASGGTTHTETFHYQDGSDSPSWTRIADTQGQEVSWDRNIEGIDGDLAGVRTSQGNTTTLYLQNLHGDIVATAPTDPNATALTARFESDEFGNPRQSSTRRYGWLGGKQRRTEMASGVIQMGVRSYIPALGRFTSVDPVKGGSATSYDYANADPVNQLDLNGEVAGCTAFIKSMSSRRKGKIKFHAKWNCPASAWPGPVTVHKITITIEREVRGLAQAVKGKFERIGGHTYDGDDIAKSQHRNWGLKTSMDCDPGYKYQVKIEVVATLQSPTGIGGGTKGYRREAKRNVKCKE